MERPEIASTDGTLEIASTTDGKDPSGPFAVPRFSPRNADDPRDGRSSTRRGDRSRSRGPEHHSDGRGRAGRPAGKCARSPGWRPCRAGAEEDRRRAAHAGRRGGHSTARPDLEERRDGIDQSVEPVALDPSRDLRPKPLPQRPIDVGPLDLAGRVLGRLAPVIASNGRCARGSIRASLCHTDALLEDAKDERSDDPRPAISTPPRLA